MAKKYRSYSRKKAIVAVDMSSKERHVFRFSSFKDASAQLKVSCYKLRRIASGEADEDYIRSRDNILYHVALEYDYVVHARPEVLEWEEIDFTSAYKCIHYLGISKDTYYRRARSSLVGIENPLPVKDQNGMMWYLTFMVQISDTMEFHQRDIIKGGHYTGE